MKKLFLLLISSLWLTAYAQEDDWILLPRGALYNKNMFVSPSRTTTDPSTPNLRHSVILLNTQVDIEVAKSHFAEIVVDCTSHTYALKRSVAYQDYYGQGNILKEEVFDTLEFKKYDEEDETDQMILAVVCSK